MTLNNESLPPNNRLGNRAGPAVRGPLATVLAVIGGAVLVILGFTFSLIIIAIAVVAGLIGFGYLWWKTRTLRRQIREQMAHQAQPGSAAPKSANDAEYGDGMPGDIIEGEVIQVIREERDSVK